LFDLISAVDPDPDLKEVCGKFLIMKQTFFFVLLLFLGACHNDLMDPLTPGALVPRTVDEDASLPALMVNGTLLHVETYGQPTDPILVLIHGGPGGDYRSLLKAKAFSDDGYFVVFYDQRGTGLSERVDRSQFSDVQIMIDDLQALIQHFRISPDQKVFLMGHSWGAMLASAYVNQHPDEINGVVLAEPGGLTWDQAKDYISRANDPDLFSEALNDALFPEQIFAGRDENEILDYKAAYFMTFENAPGNTIGNAGPYPFWRNGALSAEAMFDFAESHGFDFTTHLHAYSTKVLFAYSELNNAYGFDWAKAVGAPYPNVEYFQVNGSGHELLYFGWENFYPVALTYLNELK
jgi:proline iminopeptidase